MTREADIFPGKLFLGLYLDNSRTMSRSNYSHSLSRIRQFFRIGVMTL